MLRFAARLTAAEVGAVIGKSTAAASKRLQRALQPGAADHRVQARLDLWLKTHIEKVLSPLFSLSAAADITGMARGVPFQLVEALGVPARQNVSEDVKGRDPTARALSLLHI